MHRHCLSCSADLASNDAVEALPIGRRLAFDAWKGRLWVICPRCRRWNLTPIEERWEPVEQLEKLFRDSRTRVQSENIGIARLRDGTTLIRIGQALPGELAAWRYGEELARRRWKGLLATGSAVAVVAAMGLAGPAGLAAVGLPAGAANLAVQGYMWTRMVRVRRHVIHRVEREASPTGEELVLRRLHMDGAVISHADDGSPRLWLPAALKRDARTTFNRLFGPQRLHARDLMKTAPLVLEGNRVVRVMGRTLVAANEMGASRRQVAKALTLLEQAGGADAFVREIARADLALAVRPRSTFGHANTGYASPMWQGRELQGLPEPLRRHLSGQGRMLTRIEGLALEMALHEEKERRALEGELAQLLEEWREAEMLAGIADALPEEDRLEAKGSRR